jgi:hypothetical protein
MKKYIKFFGIFLCFFLSITQFSSCKTAEGCQLEDKYQAKTDKHGNLSKKRGDSSLFSKKERKKMRSNR